MTILNRIRSILGFVPAPIDEQRDPACPPPLPSIADAPLHRDVAATRLVHDGRPFGKSRPMSQLPRSRTLNGIRSRLTVR